MKKLAIVAFALVLAMTFVGCGVTDARVVGTWDYVYAYDRKSGDPLEATRFEFTKEGSVTTWDGTYDAEGVLVKKTANTPKTGTWLVINNEIIEIEDQSASYNGKWIVEFSGLTEMKWTNKKDGRVVPLVKVTKKPTTDAE